MEMQGDAPWQPTCLDPEAEHDTLTNMFSKVGKVTYVSLPRYEDRTLKGFAFIEFEKPESIDKAVEELNEFDSETNKKSRRFRKEI